MRITTPLAALLVAVTAAGCGGLDSSDEGSKDGDKPTTHKVAVVDHGFDISNVVFKDTVKASYEVICASSTNPLLKLAPEMRFEDLKTQFLAFLKGRTDCQAKEKINNGISPAFANIEGQFNDWNASIKAGTMEAQANRAVIQNILGGEQGKYNYHGTGTASVIARDAPANLDLVLIEVNFSTLMIPNEIDLNLGCPSQVTVDLKAQLLEDKDVRAAFIDANRPDADSVIMGLFEKHGIRIVNESYGPSSAAEFVDYCVKKGVVPPDFKRVILAESRLQRDREAALNTKYAARPLHVRASGNAGKELSLESDTLDPCKDEDDYLLVGALDRKDEITNFSNRGRCSEVYALGGQVIVDAPKNFLNVVDGTSFASPLLVRYLVANTEPGLEPSALKAFVRGKMDSAQRIKLGDWNRPFAYEPKQGVVVANQGNGGGGGGGGGGGAPATVYKEGWTAALVGQYTEECRTSAINAGSTNEVATAYCGCAIPGLAQKYTLAEAEAGGDALVNDPIILECRNRAGG